jgi:hypothetical protein
MRLSVILDSYLKVYLLSKKVRTVFFYTRGYIVFSVVKFTEPVFLVLIFMGLYSFLKQKTKIGNLLSMNNHKAP